MSTAQKCLQAHDDVERGRAAPACGCVTMFERLRLNSFLVVGRAGLDLYADPPGTELKMPTAFMPHLVALPPTLLSPLRSKAERCSLLTAVSDDAVGRYTVQGTCELWR